MPASATTVFTGPSDPWVSDELATAQAGQQAGTFKSRCIAAGYVVVSETPDIPSRTLTVVVEEAPLSADFTADVDALAAGAVTPCWGGEVTQVTTTT